MGGVLGWALGGPGEQGAPFLPARTMGESCGRAARAGGGQAFGVTQGNGSWWERGGRSGDPQVTASPGCCSSPGFRTPWAQPRDGRGRAGSCKGLGAPWVWVGASQPWRCPLEPWRPSRLLSCPVQTRAREPIMCPLMPPPGLSTFWTGTQMTLPGTFPGARGPEKGQKRDGGGPRRLYLGQS